MQSPSKENVLNVEAATQQPKQPAGSFQRGTVEFLNAELKSVALEQKNSKKHKISTIKPKTLIKRRAKKELEALFEVAINVKDDDAVTANASEDANGLKV